MEEEARKQNQQNVNHNDNNIHHTTNNYDDSSNRNPHQSTSLPTTNFHSIGDEPIDVPCSGLVHRVGGITYLTYFLDGFSSAVFLPLLAIAFSETGFAVTNTGVMLSLSQVLMFGFGATTVVSADVTRKHKFIYVVCRIINFISVFALVPAMQYPKMWAVFTASTVARASIGPCSPILDASVLHNLFTIEPTFGRVRMGLSVGRTVGGVVGGLLLPVSLVANAFAWTLSSACALAVSILMPIYAAPPPHLKINKLPQNTQSAHTTQQSSINDQKPEDATIQEKKPNFCSALLIMFSSPRFILFLLVCAVSGIGGATFDYYVVLYANVELQASGLLCGLITTFASGSAVIGYLLSEYLHKLIGDRGLIGFGMTLSITRCFLYPILTPSTKEWILLIQVLHGVQWGCFAMGAMRVCNSLAPPLIKATAQGMFGAAYFGVGTSIGLYVGGWLYHTVGPWRMFVYKGLLLAGASVVFIIDCLVGYCLSRRAADSEERLPLIEGR